jgi:predicted DNA binding CopG/RHH family protein
MKTSKRALKKKSDTLDPLAGDLSDLLQNGNWTRVKYELRPKNKTITLRVSEELLEAVKDKANENGLDYQKWIRIVLERLVA